MSRQAPAAATTFPRPAGARRESADPPSGTAESFAKPISAALLLGLSGCALGLPAYNQPFEERVVVQAAAPSALQIVIEDSDEGAVSVPDDGRVTLKFPVLPRECSTYFLGVRVKDRTVEARKLVHFVRDGRIVKKLSVHQLRRLPVDEAGFHKVRIR